MRDKRRFFRWDCSLDCSLEGEQFSAAGRIVDLSYDGACVAESPALLPEGVDLLVTLDDGEVRSSLKAHVIYRSSTEGLGLQFYGDPGERAGKLLPFFKKYLDPER